MLKSFRSLSMDSKSRRSDGDQARLRGNNPGMNAVELQERLRALRSPEAAQAAARFFKTAPGQYGEGDIFLGLRAAQIHGLAKEFQALPFDGLASLLPSPIHEDRLIALLIMVRRVVNGSAAIKRQAYRIYLGHTRYVNNWDLVDASRARSWEGIWPTRAANPWTDLQVRPVSGNDESASWPRTTSSVKMSLTTRSELPSDCSATAKT